LSFCPASAINICATENLAVREATAADRVQWDSFVASCPNAHVFQSWPWSESRTTSPWPDRWRPYRFFVERGREPVIAMAVLHRPVPFVGGLLWSPRGPAMRFADDAACVELAKAMRQLAARTGAMCLLSNPSIAPGSAEIIALEKAGFEKLSIRLPVVNMPTPVMRVSLTGSLEELLSSMDKQTRNMVRKAERSGVEVSQSHEIRDLEQFHAIYRDLGRRKEFPVRPWKDLRNLWQWMEPAQSIQLFRAVYEGELLAAAITLTFGTTCWWLYGASTEHGKNNLYPAHLLQWKIMQWAREQGCDLYDMRGAMGYNHAPGSPGYGVFHFKKGFGAELTHFAGEFGMIFRPAPYRLLTHVAPRVKQVVRHFYSRSRG
jgi:peptidoglycan pentaglycine glycine transferase (the first glycine)